MESCVICHGQRLHYLLQGWHPTQAYALIAALAISITMLIQYKQLRKYKGAVFFSVITLYSFMRFFNEILRTDSVYIMGVVKLSMFTMAVIFIIGLIGLCASLKKADNKAFIFKSTLYYFLSSLICNFFNNMK